jgi:3-oxoacyl-[acyl-carrier protein] reductase
LLGLGVGIDAFMRSGIVTTHFGQRRGARPEEVATAVIFLADPAATFFTGQCLGANGGAALA